MTGAEHYRRAEQLLESVTISRADVIAIRSDRDPQVIVAAQAHAVLALAAATALGRHDNPEWLNVAGTKSSG